MLCGLFVSSRLSAQDIILTTDDEIISAVISEIGDDSIVYKKADNPDGPNFRINTSRVVKIQFANGTTQEFNNKSQSNKQPEQVLFQPYAQPNNNQYYAPQPQQQYAQQPAVEETPVDWRHVPLAFYYWRIGMQLGNASVPSIKYTYPTKVSYDILDEFRVITSSNFTLSTVIGISGRSAKFDDGENFFDTHGLMLGVRPGYTIRFTESLRISIMAGGYIHGDLWGKVMSAENNYLSVWNITNWNHFDAGISAGLSFGISTFMEVYFEYKKGFVSYIKDSTMPEYSSTYCFGLGFDF